MVTLYFNGMIDHVHFGADTWTFEVWRMCRIGLNQTNLPAAYSKIHQDVHISSQSR